MNGNNTLAIRIPRTMMWMSMLKHHDSSEGLEFFMKIGLKSKLLQGFNIMKAEDSE